MSSIIFSGKEISFLNLLEEYQIEIPIIQRDYAQGRLDKKELRINFLEAIRNALVKENQIRLDFIYGSLVNSFFQPLDGQQRLTTLFLLHWYASIKSSEIDERRIAKLLKFSYETRISSREFCQSLIKNVKNLSAVDSLSDIIVDSNWFFLSWKKDPTIDAMLRTIDDIHQMFSDIDNLWEVLETKNLITFYFVELENIGLTDDLYIKMNARGKLLTPFENFKASFQKYINENAFEMGMSQIDVFSTKIDTIWTDYFWTHFRRDNSIDNALLRFISSVSMIIIAIEREKYKTDERSSLIQKIQDRPDSVKPVFFSKNGFNYLYNSFEKYCLLSDIDVSLDFPLWRHEPVTSILSEIVYEEGQSSAAEIFSSSYSMKVLFYAQTEYLLNIEEFDKNHFRDWMRVVRNIISRGDIDKDGKRPDIIRSPQTFDGVINLIKELSNGCQNIYLYLATIKNIKSTFAKEQVEEERIKAKLIINNPSLKKLIFDSEDNELLRGRINFLFYCIDYEKNEELDVEKLILVQTVFHRYFNKEIEINGKIQRAMLTIEVDGKYNFYDYWWSFWNVVNATKRRLFDKYREIEYYIYSEYREYFKKLVLLLCYKDYESIIADFNPPQEMPNWKKRLIKEKELLDDVSKSNYIAIPDDESCCYLLKSKRPRDMDGCIKIE
jgi:hypothetical protein